MEVIRELGKHPLLGENWICDSNSCIPLRYEGLFDKCCWQQEKPGTKRKDLTLRLSEEPS